MLVLSRKTDEEIQIGEGIVIRVIRVAGKKVRIGIEAPAEVSIRRGELLAAPKTSISNPTIPSEPAPNSFQDCKQTERFENQRLSIE